METPTTYGHVNGLAIYERPTPDFDPVRRGVPAVRLAGRASGAAAPTGRRGAVRARSSVLGRRPALRPRLPRPPDRPGAARGRRPAGRAGGPHHRPTDGPPAPAVGGLRDRGPRRRSVGDAHEVPPRDDRRRGRRDHAEDVHRPGSRHAVAVRAGRLARRGDPERHRVAQADGRATWWPTRSRPPVCRSGWYATSPTPPVSPASAVSPPGHAS